MDFDFVVSAMTKHFGMTKKWYHQPTRKSLGSFGRPSIEGAASNGVSVEVQHINELWTVALYDDGEVEPSVESADPDLDRALIMAKQSYNHHINERIADLQSQMFLD